jgi:tetratricopeptide (TPR) repeat protein
MLPPNFKRGLIWILFLVFSHATGFSQTKKIDSLKLLLVNAKEDTVKFRIYYNIAGEYWIGLKDTIDYENTFKYEDSAFNLAKKLNYTYGIFDCLMCYGNVTAYQQKFLDSRRYYIDAIETAKLLGDKKIVANSYLEMADNFFVYGKDAQKNTGNFPFSLEFYFKALKTFEEVGDKYKTAKTWFFIGRLYAWHTFFNMGQGNAPEIEKSVLNAMKIFKESQETTQADIAGCNLLLGRSNYFQGKYSKALELFFVSLKYNKDSSDKSVIANDYLNIGRAYKGLGDSSFAKGSTAYASKMFTEALNYLQLALKLQSELKLDGFMALSYSYIGDIQIFFKQFSLSKDNLNKAIIYTDKLGGAGTYQEIYQSLAKLDSAQGDYKSALRHFKMFMAYKDSTVNRENSIKLEGYRLQYDFDKKEDSLNQKQIITETKLSAQKKQRYFYWAGLALLALLSFFIFLTFRNQKKINRLAGESHSKEKAELELQSLRAQLNPHFMFNSLNAIQELILLEENDKAQSYLARFSKLLRMLLENAERPFIPLQREIDFLQLYLSLENLRIPDLRYHITVDPGIDTEQTAIPNMILQPYIENAIWHGLSHKQSDRDLHLQIIKANNVIQYEIKDNGVGRKKAAELKSLFRKEHKSKGMELLSKRFKLLAKEFGSDIETTVEDVVEKNEVAGTVVTIKVPQSFSQQNKKPLA